MKSIILIRTSSKDQHPELQLKECEDYNLSHGWNLVKVFSKQESAYKNEDGVWKEELEWAKKNDIRHIIVWNMDRFSRLEEERVLDEVKALALLNNIQLHAVHGDAWSELTEAIGRLNEMGFVGKALAEFLETVIRGMEFRRAHRESKIKGERVKMAIRKEGAQTVSYKGNKWGRKAIPEGKIVRIRELASQKKSMREIALELGLSKTVVHKYLHNLIEDKSFENGHSSISQ